MIPFADILSNGLGLLKELFGYKREQANRVNTPEQQANAKAAQDAATTDQAREAVAKGDTDAIQRGLS